MPKVPIDYSKTIIYKLVHFDDLNDENIYVGHTTNMTKRRCRHKNACCNPNNKHYNLKVYQFIRENGGWDQWEMILIEKYPCKDEPEAIVRERYWKRELNATLNTQEPGRTSKEYYQDKREEILKEKKNYHIENRNKRIEYNKEYRKNKKEEIAERRKEKITCECGSIVSLIVIARHRKSNKHEKLMKNNNLTIN